AAKRSADRPSGGGGRRRVAARFFLMLEFAKVLLLGIVRANDGDLLPRKTGGQQARNGVFRLLDGGKHSGPDRLRLLFGQDGSGHNGLLFFACVTENDAKEVPEMTARSLFCKHGCMSKQRSNLCPRLHTFRTGTKRPAS